MTLTVTIQKEDFLLHQLYIASQSDNINKRRRRNKFIFPIIYSIFSIYYFSQDKIGLAIFLGITAVLWFILFPIWEAKYYKTHYNKFIEEHYKNRFNQLCQITFNENEIIVKDLTGESIIYVTELVEIVELQTIVLVRFKSGISLILPKRDHDDLQDIKSFLLTLASRLNINYTVAENWKWT